MNLPKKIKIICEPTYADSIGCKQLLSGVMKVLKKRRFNYEFTLELQDSGPADIVCVIGISKVWIEQAIKVCNEQECKPIVLSNQLRRSLNGSYHLICPDIRGMLTVLKENLEAAGRIRIALYGVNRVVDLDREHISMISEFVSDPENIYQNTGNLEGCFRSFLPKAKYYDAVVCVNGYAALSLAKKLEKECPEVLETLVIISFEEALRHSKFNQWISLVDLQLESYGAVAIAISEMAAQRADISSMTVEMECDVCDIAPKKHKEAGELSSADSQMFEDPEIVSMAKIEQLLRDADDMDHHIIAMLLSNAKYSEIADSCYMTEGNVKYRVKKYMSICSCKTKKELLELLQEYLQ